MNQQCICIVCEKNHEIKTIYSMYLFCSEKCYSDYRKLSTKRQLELSERPNQPKVKDEN